MAFARDVELPVLIRVEPGTDLVVRKVAEERGHQPSPVEDVRSGIDEREQDRRETQYLTAAVVQFAVEGAEPIASPPPSTEGSHFDHSPVR